MKPIISQKDFYSQQAKKENYPARSVYKLKEMQEKFHLVRKGGRVLDLGCAPGSWLKYLAEVVGPKGRVVGVDRETLQISLKTNMRFIKKDVFSDDLFNIPELSEKYQTVVSDLAPKTSGIKFQDNQESLQLCQRALKIAKRVLSNGGHFLCKILEGEDSQRFLNNLKKSFRSVQRFKPKASHKESNEFYIIAQGFRS